MAGTAFSELKRRVLLRLSKSDGRAVLAAEEGINEAMRNIARVRDFDELITLNTTTAFTVQGTKSYDPTTNWGLTRFKDIISIRLMNTDQSRKLIWVPLRELDEIIPYAEQVSEGLSTWYTQRGGSYELIRIPDAAYHLYITHSQWPLTLTTDAQTCSYLNLDDVIVALGAEIALAIHSGSAAQDWVMRAKSLLGMGLTEHTTKPDQIHVARPFRADDGRITDDYWYNPFIKSDPR